MKRLNLKNVFGITMAFVLMTASFAFAEDAQTASPNAIEPAAVEEEASQHQLFIGTINEITKSESGVYSIAVVSEDETVVFVYNDQFIIDQSSLSLKTVEDLAKGSEITVIWDKLSPMTLSLPPITPGAIGFVINSEDGFIDLSEYNEELVNSDNSLKLNISEDTVILSSEDSEAALTENDLKGKELLVLYGASTKSIPAQTTPGLIMVINEKAAEEEKEEASEEVAIPLRSTFEELGYTVLWTSNSEPVLISKDDVTISVSLGSSVVKYGDEEHTFGLPATLQADSMYISSKIKDIL